MVKKRKIGKGNLCLVEPKCGVRQIITVICVPYVQEDF